MIMDFLMIRKQKFKIYYENKILLNDIEHHINTSYEIAKKCKDYTLDMLKMKN